jgi:hypothetical protein
MKLRLPMSAGTRDVTALVIVSMALETGGGKKSPRARAAVRDTASALGAAAITMRAATPTPAAAVKVKIDGIETHRAFSRNRGDGAAA